MLPIEGVVALEMLFTTPIPAIIGAALEIIPGVPAGRPVRTAWPKREPKPPVNCAPPPGSAVAAAGLIGPRALMVTVGSSAAPALTVCTPPVVAAEGAAVVTPGTAEVTPLAAPGTAAPRPMLAPNIPALSLSRPKALPPASLPPTPAIPAIPAPPKAPRPAIKPFFKLPVRAN